MKYFNFNMTQEELCRICAPILFGTMKDAIRAKCQVPTCPMLSKSKRDEWRPVTVVGKDGKHFSAHCYVEYPTGQTSMIIHTDKIRL